MPEPCAGACGLVAYSTATTCPANASGTAEHLRPSTRRWCAQHRQSGSAGLTGCRRPADRCASIASVADDRRAAAMRRLRQASRAAAATSASRNRVSDRAWSIARTASSRCPRARCRPLAAARRRPIGRRRCGNRLAAASASSAWRCESSATRFESSDRRSRFRTAVRLGDSRRTRPARGAPLRHSRAPRRFPPRGLVLLPGFVGLTSGFVGLALGLVGLAPRRRRQLVHGRLELAVDLVAEPVGDRIKGSLELVVKCHGHGGRRFDYAVAGRPSQASPAQQLQRAESFDGIHDSPYIQLFHRTIAPDIVAVGPIQGLLVADTLQFGQDGYRAGFRFLRQFLQQPVDRFNGVPQSQPRKEFAWRFQVPDHQERDQLLTGNKFGARTATFAGRRRYPVRPWHRDCLRKRDPAPPLEPDDGRDAVESPAPARQAGGAFVRQAAARSFAGTERRP